MCWRSLKKALEFEDFSARRVVRVDKHDMEFVEFLKSIEKQLSLEQQQNLKGFKFEEAWRFDELVKTSPNM